MLPFTRQDSSLSNHSQHSQSSKNLANRVKDPILENTPIQIDQSAKEKQTKLILHGRSNANGDADNPTTSAIATEVYFPYKPYEAQVKYMEGVLQCLETKSNGLLESPTGTGKTLSLLCASLAWLKKTRETAAAAQQHQQQSFGNVSAPPIIPHRIIYTSRTHSQLQQAVKELRRTVYIPKVAVQGSREHYCIKKEYEQLKSGILTAACMKAIQPTNPSSHCRFYRSGGEDTRDFFQLRIPDIEDLRIDGYNNNYCPYFATQRVSNAVDVLFLPYNYLLDRNVSAQVGVNITNAVIIFDEAHNIQKVAEEGFSLQLSYSTLCAAENDVISLRKMIESSEADIKQLSEHGKNATGKLLSSSFDCVALIKPIQSLKAYFKTRVSSSETQYFNGDKIFEIIQVQTRTEVDRSTEMQDLHSQLLMSNNNFEKGINLANIHEYLEKAGKAQKDLTMGVSHYGLEIWINFLLGLKDLWYSNANYQSKQRQTTGKNQKTMQHQALNLNPFAHPSFSQQQQFSSVEDRTDVMRDYKLYFDLEEPSNPQLNLSCLNSSLNFKRILALQPHCLIFTSGTLQPFDSWSSETSLRFPVILENDHVINTQKQLLAMVVKQRPVVNNTNSYASLSYKNNFNFSYEKRKDPSVIDDLGVGLLEFFNVIPSGILVVFPSNTLMDACKQAWNYSAGRIIQRMIELKNVYWECKNNTENTALIGDYRIKAKQPRGAVFFCVARGKITEGIDFSDEYARAVIIVGVPYPPLKNLRVTVKREYLNELKKQTELNPTNSEHSNSVFPGNVRISGNEWYVQEAIRAVNQSIGRVIRHIHDWGSIIFLDERFSQENLLASVPKWCNVAVSGNFEESIAAAFEFFHARKREILESKQELMRQAAQRKKEQEAALRREQVVHPNNGEGMQNASDNNSNDCANNNNNNKKRVFAYERSNQSRGTLKKFFSRQNVLEMEVKKKDQEGNNSCLNENLNSSDSDNALGITGIQEKNKRNSGLIKEIKEEESNKIVGRSSLSPPSQPYRDGKQEVPTKQKDILSSQMILTKRRDPNDAISSQVIASKTLLAGRITKPGIKSNSSNNNSIFSIRTQSLQPTSTKQQYLS